LRIVFIVLFGDVVVVWEVFVRFLVVMVLMMM